MPIEAILRRHGIEYELRSAGAKELVYEAQLADGRAHRSRGQRHPAAAAEDGETEVVWDEKKK